MDLVDLISLATKNHLMTIFVQRCFLNPPDQHVHHNKGIVFMNLITLAQQQGLNPKWVAGTYGGEYVAFCPECGGKDRFRIWPNQKMNNCIGSYWCRKCNISGDSIQFCVKYHCRSFKEAIQCVGASMSIKSMSALYIKPEAFKPSKMERPPDKWTVNANTFC